MIIHIDGIDQEATADQEKAIKAEQVALSKAQAQANAEREALKEATLAKLGLTADEVAALLS
jgi:hypothetical protein